MIVKKKEKQSKKRNNSKKIYEPRVKYGGNSYIYFAFLIPTCSVCYRYKNLLAEVTSYPHLGTLKLYLFKQKDH